MSRVLAGSAMSLPPQRDSQVTQKPAGTVGDVRRLPFEDQSIDVCFDKATLDAMLTSEKDPWVSTSVRQYYRTSMLMAPWRRTHLLKLWQTSKARWMRSSAS